MTRIVCGKRGKVPMTMLLRLRFDYGRVIPWVQRVGPDLRAVAGPDGLVLRTPVETRGHDFRTEAEFQVEPGDRIPLTLTWFPRTAHRQRRLMPRTLSGKPSADGRNGPVSAYGNTGLDASLLLMPLVGFLPVDDPRVAGTVKAIAAT